MADILRGNTSLSKIYRGQTELSKVYRGQTEIWSAGGGLPPVGSYVTSNLAYYYDFGEDSSYAGSGTTITNLAPSGTKRGDAVIYQGTRDLGTQTTAGTTWDSVKRTLKMGGSGGTWDQYTTDQNWFGDITNADPDPWEADLTAEFGFYYYPNTWTGQNSYGAIVTQRNAGPGMQMSERELVIFGTAGYNFTSYSWVTGDPYIVTVTWSGANAILYINGSQYATLTTATTRRDANASPMVWGCLYTQESGNDRLGNPSWSAYQYVRFYEGKALNSTEVTQNYNANKARLGLS